MTRLRLLLATSLLFMLAACGAPSASEVPTAVAEPTAAPTRTPRATPAPQPTVVPTDTALPTAAATQLPVATLTAELSATVAAALPPTITPQPGESSAPFGGIDRVDVLPLAVQDGAPPLWAVASDGARSADPPQNHFVAIYTRDATGWVELDRVELEHYDYLGDYSDRPGVVQATVEPSNIWLEVRGGYGAHSTGYDLLRFGGRKLHDEVTAGTPGGSAGWLADLNGDRTPEVVLDRSDYYVFCFACGVVRWNYEVRRWDGSRMVEVQLAPAPETAPAELRRLSDRAVAQAQAGLWKDAWATVSQTLALGAKDETAQWDAALIRLVAEARAMQAASGAYPLLDHLFYGDYPAALDVMRAHTPAELFARDTPLVSGTAAAGWEPELTNWITETVNPALEARPDLAAAYFLRGWAVHLSYPDNPAALADVERAAQLAPQEKLFAESAGYLKGQR